MLSTYLSSLIRTGSGYVIAWLLSLKLAGPVLSLFGVDSATAKERLTAAAVIVVGTAYYAIARLLEQKFPALTVLLGSTKQPVAYASTSANQLQVDGNAIAKTVATSPAFKGIVDSLNAKSAATTDPFFDGPSAAPVAVEPAPEPPTAIATTDIPTEGQAAS
jgi:hypothetical protein